MLFVSIYWYIILVETFQKRPKKTEFQKPFALISIQTEVTHEKSRLLAQINDRGDLLNRVFCGWTEKAFHICVLIGRPRWPQTNKNKPWYGSF